MLNKIMTHLKKLPSIKTGNIQTSMKIIYCYGGGLSLLTLLMIIGWLSLWYQTGKPDMPTLITIFKEFTAPAVVAAFTFVAIFCVDKDRDGRPDAAVCQVTNMDKKTTTTTTSTITNTIKNGVNKL